MEFLLKHRLVILTFGGNSDYCFFDQLFGGITFSRVKLFTIDCCKNQIWLKVSFIRKMQGEIGPINYIGIELEIITKFVK